MGDGKRSHQGYEVIETCTVEGMELVIGHHPAAPNPYVCWYCKNGTDYYWGYYTNELQTAREKLIERYQEKCGIARSSLSREDRKQEAYER